MPNELLLSIVVPCFNRHDILSSCIRSLDVSARDAIEVVVVDDGSEPPLRETIGPLLSPQDVLVRLPQNRGRATALREGILRAQGTFTMIMDSDDEFVPGAMASVVDELRAVDRSKVVGLVYACVNFETGEKISVLPDGQDMSLLALRADAHVKGDVKEVVATDVVRAALYDEPGAERRVPTSYIWAGVARAGLVRPRDRGIVRHRYLPGGMTSTVPKLRRENPRGVIATHVRIVSAPRHCYASLSFRFAHAVRAFAVPGAQPSHEEVRMIRTALGGPLTQAARLLGGLAGRFR